MEIETLKHSHVKRNILIGVGAVLIISAIVLNFTRAKYRSVATTPLIHSTINYSLADLNIVAITVEGEKVDTIPTGNYELSEESYCEVNGNRDDNISLTYDNDTQTLNVVPFTTKGTKCYLDFVKGSTAGEQILANYTNLQTRTNFSTTVTNRTTGTIYYADTSKGRTYYFAGNPTDNWVYFGGFYWRIIRINEDGSIRMIYAGESSTTVLDDRIQNSAFNSSYNDNMYVGYMYQGNQVHGLETDSTIKVVLDNWYEDNLLENYADQISTEAGFCGDREPSTSYSSSNGNGGIGTQLAYYGAYIRLVHGKNPTFECKNTTDLYTVGSASGGNKALDYPIGLIAADEVAYAGGVHGSANRSYYLYYSGTYYWTMSPRYFFSEKVEATMFRVSGEDGSLDADVVNAAYAVRPVINLSADVTITGSGTTSDPYIVS